MTDMTVDVQKALVRAKQNGFVLQDQHDVVNMGNLAKPRLLTALMGGATATVYNQTSVFEYDLTEYTPAAVNGKSYTERGKDIEKDVATTKYYKIGSKGIRLNASPADAWERRKPGTNDFLTTDDVLADQVMKAMDAFDIERELEYSSLLTTRTNRTAGGPFPQYDFHQDILGAAIPGATDIDFSSVGATPLRAIRLEVEKMDDKLAKYGLSASGYVCVAGSNFFEAAFEAEARRDFTREIRGSLDLATMGVPTFDGNGFRHQNFDSGEADVMFIKYSAKLIGAAMIDTDSAYLIPILSGQSMVKEVYAPAVTMSTVNQMAREMYSWFYEDEFEGVTGFYEQNKLSMLPRPDLITELAAV